MTQQPQDEFESSVESAVDWMKTIQERLRINDNTKGPRSALEARLRDTEKICQLEPEGRLKVDLVLMKADALLRCLSEEKKHKILSKLKDVKAMWEETAIYITHCHSRIEWVWLHWSEYLKAQDEFNVWIHNMKVTLEPDIELQLGLKEKQWQLSHAQVLLNDVINQSTLLERLLEEAASLYNRIGDPSVDEDVQKKMKAEYEEVKTEAQRRVQLLEKITQEHERYKGSVDQFHLWLTRVTERLNSCLSQGVKVPAENRIKSLQDITKDVKNGEKKLRHLEAQSLGVMENTSPLGAEKMKDELEELKKALEKLKVACLEEEERLMKTLRSENAYHSQARLLEAEVQEFLKNLQRLRNNFEPNDRVRSEEDLIALWRRYMATRAALAEEESKVDRLKAQLKELFRFSQDMQPLSESVICAIREYQRYFPAIQEELAECAVQMEELEKCAQSDPSQMHKIKPLSSDCQALKRSLEKLQAEFPDKEIQLHLVEAHGQLVEDNSSPEGAAHVRTELEKLKGSWKSLEDMMSSLLKKMPPGWVMIDARMKETLSEQTSSEMDETEHYQENLAKGEDANGFQLVKDFEQWLRGENATLSKILATKPSSNKECKTRHSKLKELQCRVPEGQRHFEGLLRLPPAVQNSEELEELRYQWMLYKSKLNDSSNSLITSFGEEPISFRKGRGGGVCSFLRRVCWAALPLQLLLLLLLLLAFLLPLMEETHSCKLANNFARSFNLMLRYKGPPPT
ncbi:PREDICTED: nesprin-3 [Gekko japonicus]|uniref:Nesprin-3 n=1 Tax=Gekko japonicus TaxID=146911 RepID=A0ABM1KDN9_GEKJA|nr:PREDICTED: nesprin-3 [Gekko japonicus]